MKSNIWLAADYQFPMTYSIRIPNTSSECAKSMPAPGPGTVRLAMIRRAINIFGLPTTKDNLFSAIRAANLMVRPPEQVAMSLHSIRHLRPLNERGNKSLFKETPVQREYAFADGYMTIFIEISTELKELFTQIFENIGYWGQACSFAFCVKVYPCVPDPRACCMPMESLNPNNQIEGYFSCPVTDLVDHVEWEDLTHSSNKPWNILTPHAIQTKLYVWPLIIWGYHGRHKLLVRQPFRST